jgi:hypothetical protein
MPTRSTVNFPRTLSDDEFEDLIRDLCAREWDDPHTQRFGRSGQSQMGVDVYGKPNGMNYRAAQCKLRSRDTLLTKKTIEAEVKEANKFPHKLDELIIVTDHPRDTNVQIFGLGYQAQVPHA